MQDARKLALSNIIQRNHLGALIFWWPDELVLTLGICLIGEFTFLFIPGRKWTYYLFRKQSRKICCRRVLG